MIELEKVPCKTQVLVCTNERPGDKPCCSQVGGPEFFQKLKAQMKERGLNSHIWVTKTGCLGYCNSVGTTIALQKEGQPRRWFSEVTAQDFEKIWEEVTSP